MTDKQTEARDEGELVEDLDPTDEAATEVSGGASGVERSSFSIVKTVDASTPGFHS